MANPDGWRARWARFMNRVQARRSARARPATAFVSTPEPRTVGSFARGRQLTAGNLMFAGHLIEAPGAMIWDLDPPDAPFEEEIHGFAWLDDLAAVGEAGPREVAQAWTWGWISRYGRGAGPGWTPEQTGRRLIRWIHHAIFLLRGQDKPRSDIFFRSLGQQTLFLGKRWHTAPEGLPQIEALTGLIYAGLSLTGMEAYVDPALKALEQACAKQVDKQGGIPTRNPEELLEVFTLLTWVASALDEAHRRPGPELTAAIGRIAPTLRSLRHADGGLARFHGGGRGLDGRLDQALAASGVKKWQAEGLSMGFARLSAGRTSVIVDAAPPPQGAVSMNGHASTLAFELTSGRRPLIVNCGSGAVFGEDWRRAGRATPSHSALSLDGYSSARLGKVGRIGAARREMLEDTPTNVPVEISSVSDGVRFEGGHDGYVATHGLTHARILELTFDGRGVVGEDMLLALQPADKKQFDRKLDETTLQGIAYAARFHLHPEVDAELDLGGAAVSMVLRSGEVWVFRHDGSAELSLEPSVYLEKGRLRPRATKQIVLSGRAMQYATRIRWSLAKAQDTAVAIRDLARDELDLTS
ncbi:heparinase II/III family protein [Mesobacterium sp. TK19101]|uniref:Heparinase II/III family protein n=1 Tax=Mesobacterium hydrothermale TaxID=3111907 RepID=A0ABU6HLM4_9RHOB|nr:heparinase II/III family protein [Mesobacterium sp. TK19101]MEC3863354.1 heparinase II/III family protein [Mesobacterium sp. TK19101]